VTQVKQKVVFKQVGQSNVHNWQALDVLFLNKPSGQSV